jgi:PAT family beta-lactamase induction signal transducer AmpG
MMVKLGLFRSLMFFGIVQAITNLLFFMLAMMGQNYAMFVLTVGLENFGGGLGTAAFMALVMSLCNTRYTATQFALLSALAAVGRVYVGPVAGYIVESVGWAEFYLWTVVFAIPGLALLWWLRPVIKDYARQEEDRRVEAKEAAAAS